MQPAGQAYKHMYLDLISPNTSHSSLPNTAWVVGSIFCSAHLGRRPHVRPMRAWNVGVMRVRSHAYHARYRSWASLRGMLWPSWCTNERRILGGSDRATEMRGGLWQGIGGHLMGERRRVSTSPGLALWLPPCSPGRFATWLYRPKPRPWRRSSDGGLLEWMMMQAARSDDAQGQCV